MILLPLIAALSVAIATPTWAVTERSAAVRASFQRATPCPANGMRRGPCPGYIADHIDPLCAGGADAANNMQWQTVSEAKRKDKLERAACRARRPLP